MWGLSKNQNSITGFGLESFSMLGQSNLKKCRIFSLGDNLAKF